MQLRSLEAGVNNLDMWAATGYPKWIGIGLMLYPYAVSQTWLLYAIGAGLCAALYFFSK
jgi:hypothetical protein